MRKQATCKRRTSFHLCDYIIWPSNQRAVRLEIIAIELLDHYWPPGSHGTAQGLPARGPGPPSEPACLQDRDIQHPSRQIRSRRVGGGDGHDCRVHGHSVQGTACRVTAARTAPNRQLPASTPSRHLTQRLTTPVRACRYHAYCPTEHLQWPSRRDRILRELQEYGGDIIALQVGLHVLRFHALSCAGMSCARMCCVTLMDGLCNFQHLAQSRDGCLG